VITDIITTAPAGVLVPGSVDARPYAGAAVRPCLLGAVVAAQGTGVPSAGPAPRFRGTARTGLGVFAAHTQQHDLMTQHDGTTPLGDCSSRRPLS
jgi:hypothetical protein